MDLDALYLWLTAIAAIAVASFMLATIAAHWTAERYTVHWMRHPGKPRTQPCPACTCDVCKGEGRIPA